MSLELALASSAPAEGKTQFFVHLSFNSIFQLINDISSDVKKLFRYFHDTAIVVSLKILLNPSATLFPSNLALYFKIYKIYSIRTIIIKISCFIFRIKP